MPKTPNATRNLTPPSDITTPNYSVPQFNKPHSPPNPPSPSNEAVKRRKILNQIRQSQQTSSTARDQVQDMAVDEENPRPLDAGEGPARDKGSDWQNRTPTGQDATARHTTDKDPSANPEDDIFVEVDEVENAKTMARIMNRDRSPSEVYQQPPPTPTRQIHQEPDARDIR